VRKEYKVLSVPKIHLKSAVGAAETVISFAISRPDFVEKMQKNSRKQLKIVEIGALFHTV
jgi:hypothetical protein